MKKKTYMMPLVCVYAIETSTFLADSNNQAKPARLGFSFGSGDDEITNGDGDNVWE